MTFHTVYPSTSSDIENLNRITGLLSLISCYYDFRTIRAELCGGEAIVGDRIQRSYQLTRNGIPYLYAKMTRRYYSASILTVGNPSEDFKMLSNQRNDCSIILSPQHSRYPRNQHYHTDKQMPPPGIHSHCLLPFDVIGSRSSLPHPHILDPVSRIRLPRFPRGVQELFQNLIFPR